MAFTISGNTARLVARLRPTVPIVALTPSQAVYHRLSLVWGVTPLMCDYVERLDELCDRVGGLLLGRGFVQPGLSFVGEGPS